MFNRFWKTPTQRMMTQPLKRALSGRVRLSFETLESRDVPSATIVKDLNIVGTASEASGAQLFSVPVSTGPVSSGGNGIASTLGGYTYFAATTPTTGSELYRSDGTAANTTLVDDIYAGTGSSSPANFTLFNGLLYFTASDSTHGNQLWKTDGTAGGTTLVSSTFGTTTASPSNLTVYNGSLYFTVSSATLNTDLYSVSTSNTVTLVKQIFTGAAPTAYPIGKLTIVGTNPTVTSSNNKLYFTAPTSSSGTSTQLWVTDGTAANTLELSTAVTITTVANLANLNGTLFFTASSSATGVEPWVSNGTVASTQLLADIYPGTSGSVASTSIAVLNGVVYFRADIPNPTNAALGIVNVLYQYDGVHAPAPISDATYGDTVNYFPSNLIVYNNELFFTANPAGTGLSYSSLYYYNPTAPTPAITLVGSPNPNGTSTFTNFTVAGSSLYFSVNDGSYGYEPWVVTASGTATPSLTELTPINANNTSTAQSSFTDNSSNGVVLFLATDAPTATATTQLFASTDGMTASVVKVINPSNGSSSPTNIQAGPNGLTYFLATPTGSTKQLFVTDGTAANTTQLTSFTGTTSTAYYTITPSGTLVLAYNSIIYIKYSGDSTFTSVSGVFTNPQDFVVTANGSIYFTSSGPFLYEINGTGSDPYGADLVSGPGDTFNYSTNTVLGNEVFYSTTDSTNGPLNVASGTTGSQFAAFHPYLTPGNSIGYYNCTAVTTTAATAVTSGPGAVLFFTATDPSTGTSGLYVTNGIDSSSANTQIVLPMSSTNGVYYSSLRAADGKLYFTIYNSTAGTYEPWVSDGTVGGTYQLANIVSGSTLAIPASYTAVGNSVYFTASNGIAGYALYKTDGTTANTGALKNFPGPSPSAAIGNLVNVNSVLYFTASNDSLTAGTGTGNELWSSDGTSQGTVLDSDIDPGSATSSPSSLTANGTQLFLSANNGVTGAELYTEVPIGSTTTTTTFTDSASAAVALGTSLTFSITVSNGTGTIPTGVVTLEDSGVTGGNGGGNVIGTADLSASGTATITTSLLAAGSHTIVASYSGDPANAVSYSTAKTQVVNKSTTIPTVSAPTITTTSAYFSSVSTASWASSVATIATAYPSGVTVGETVTVASVAPSGFNGTVVVTGTPTSTSFTYALTTNPGTYTSGGTVTGTGVGGVGSPVTIAETIGAGTTGISPTGTVTFEDASNGNAVIGTAVVGTTLKASLITSNLSLGSHNIIAVYSGDVNYTGSTSASGTTEKIIAGSTISVVNSTPSLLTYGQAVTLTATVTSGGAPVTSGLVEFEVSSNPTISTTTALGTVIGTVALNSQGMAVFTGSSASIGANIGSTSHNYLFAVYTGGAAVFESSSVSSQQNVTQASTSTTLTISSANNPSVYGHAFTVSATVTNGTTYAPTGTVYLYQSGTTSPQLGIGSLTAGSNSSTATLTVVASVAAANLFAGNDSLYLVYSPDQTNNNFGVSNNLTSPSPSLNETITPTNTTTVLQDGTTSTITYGTPVTLTATVSNGLTTKPTGMVNFEDTVNGSVVILGSEQLISGVATITLPSPASQDGSTPAVNPLPAGTNNLFAVYGGDASNNPSQSTGTVSQTVTFLPTSTSLYDSGPNPSASGQQISFVVGVQNNTEGVVYPSGTVTLEDAYNNDAVLGSGTLSYGTASVYISPPAGKYDVIAVYGGDGGDTGSVSSPAILQTVTGVTLTDGGPSPSAVGQAVSFTASVVTGSTTAATGRITLEQASTNAVLGTGTLTAGTVTIPVTGLSVGANSIIAVYGGDGSNPAGNSQAVTQTVGPTVSSILIDGGATPQTRVTSLTVAFTGPVTLTPGAFSITRSSDGSTITDAGQISVANPSGDGFTYVLTFTGGSPLVNNGTLADGTYTLTVNAANVSDTATGTAMPANVTKTFTSTTAQAPAVSGSPLINGGGTGNVQRSLVTSLTVTFTTPVTIAAGAFTLTRQSDGSSITSASNGGITVTNPSLDGETYVLTFSGSAAVVQNGSLADGLYVLNISHTLVTAGGQPMTADYNSPTSGASRIYRLFGDFNGDGSVNGADFAAFASAYNAGPNDPNYQSYFDFTNANQGINSADFTQFSDRYGTSV